MNTETTETQNWTITKVLWDLIRWAVGRSTDITRRLAMLQRPRPALDRGWQTLAADTYSRSLKRLIGAIIALPFIMLAIAIFVGKGWVIGMAGIFGFFAVITVSAVAVPLALIIEAGLGGIKGTLEAIESAEIGILEALSKRMNGIGQRLVNWILFALLVELTFTMYVMVVPIRKNPLSIPAALVSIFTLIILAIMAKKGETFRRIARRAAILVFLASTLSFFLPQSFAAAGKKLNGVDRTVTSAIEEGLVQKFGDYPLCADQMSHRFEPHKGTTYLEIQMHPECWSGWIVVPPGWNYYLHGQENKGMEMYFQDGYRVWVAPDTAPWFKRRGVFRVRGEGKLIASISK